ncbi:unnamed protein product [Clonostachys solani]|uniref:Uncharacterized protein n=1 Tax=Clonostachys solani TaxID=160281 RepID=A0A9N9ZHT3_9HYPO|nr:unnamed protein product [Clonostachys solani]
MVLGENAAKSTGLQDPVFYALLIVGPSQIQLDIAYLFAVIIYQNRRFININFSDRTLLTQDLASISQRPIMSFVEETEWSLVIAGNRFGFDYSRAREW